MHAYKQLWLETELIICFVPNLVGRADSKLCAGEMAHDLRKMIDI
jgi:hypothetical protein